ncbi:MAG: hypothetical protein RR994_05085, partial [Clostridia bacterium]
MKRIVSLVLALTFISCSAFAIPPTPTVGYDNVRELICKSNPQIKTLQLSIDGADSAIAQLNDSLS